jgi:hypothetical protein
LSILLFASSFFSNLEISRRINRGLAIWFLESDSEVSTVGIKIYRNYIHMTTLIKQLID